MDQIENEFPTLSPKRNLLRPRVSTGLESGPNKDLGKFIVGKMGADATDDAPIYWGFTLKNPNSGVAEERVSRIDAIASKEEVGLKAGMVDFVASLGLDIEIDVVRERLEKTKLSLVDKSVSYNLGGWHDAPHRIANVRFSGDELIGYERHSAKHELFHAASSQLFKETILRSTGEKERTAIVSGLERGSGLRISHSWLNEGVTETLTRMYESSTDSEPETPSPYTTHEEVLEEIVRISGIPLKTFFEAYFEEPQLSAEPGERMPKLHQLQTLLNDTFGPRFSQTISRDYGSDPYKLRRLLAKDEHGKTPLENMSERWQQEKNEFGTDEARRRRGEDESLKALKRKIDREWEDDP